MSLRQLKMSLGKIQQILHPRLWWLSVNYIWSSAAFLILANGHLTKKTFWGKHPGLGWRRRCKKSIFIPQRSECFFQLWSRETAMPADAGAINLVVHHLVHNLNSPGAKTDIWCKTWYLVFKLKSGAKSSIWFKWLTIHDLVSIESEFRFRNILWKILKHSVCQ